MQEQLNNLERSIGRIEGKLDGVLVHLEKINGSIKCHDNRLDNAEQEITKAKGIAVGVSMVVSTIVAVATFFIKGK